MSAAERERQQALRQDARDRALEARPSLVKRIAIIREPDRGLDRELALALGLLKLDAAGRLFELRPDGGKNYGGLSDDVLIPRFTASVDASLRAFPMLIDGGRSGWSFRLDVVLNPFSEGELDIGGVFYRVQAFTPALAAAGCLAAIPDAAIMGTA